MIHLDTEPWSQDDHPTTESSHDIKVIKEPIQPSQITTQEQDSKHTIQTKTSHIIKKKRCKPPLKNDEYDHKSSSKTTTKVDNNERTNFAWELRFLTNQITRQLHCQKQFEYNVSNSDDNVTAVRRVEIYDPLKFLPTNLCYPPSSRYSIQRGTRTTTEEPPQIGTVHYTVLYTNVLQVMTPYIEKGNPVAVLGDLDVLIKFKPQCTIAIHDPCNPNTTVRCWALFNTKHTYTNVLGLTPIHFVVNKPLEDTEVKGQPTDVTRDPLYVHFLGEFVASEEARIKRIAKVVPKKTVNLTVSCENAHASCLQQCNSSLSDAATKRTAFRKLTEFFNKIHVYHPTRCGNEQLDPYNYKQLDLYPQGKSTFTTPCSECISITLSDSDTVSEYPPCIKQGLAAIIGVLTEGRENHLTGRAATYATKLVPFLEKEDAKVLVMSFFTDLLTRSSEVSMTAKKTIKKILHFVEATVLLHPEEIGRVILEILRNNESVMHQTIHPIVWARLSEWVKKNTTQNDTDVWIVIAKHLGMQPQPKITYLGVGCGSSSLNEDTQLNSQSCSTNSQNNPYTVGGWNVNSLKKRWDHSPEGWYPKSVSQYTYMSRREKRNLPFQDVVHCSGTPDVLFVFESKATLQTILNLPGMFSWRKANQYQHVYSTWTTSHRNSAGHAGTCAFSKITPEHMIYGFNTPHHNWEGEGRVITLIFKSHIVVGTYSPCSGYDSTRKTRKAEFEMLLQQHFREIQELYPQKRCITLVGDLNVNPRVQDCHPLAFKHMAKVKKTLGSQAGEHDPGCSPLEVQAYQDTCNTFAGVNVFEHLYPTSQKGQTWVSPLDPFGYKNWGQRVDHFIVSENLLNHEADTQVEDMVTHQGLGNSDHWMITMSFVDEQQSESQQTYPKKPRIIKPLHDLFKQCQVKAVTTKGDVHQYKPNNLPILSLPININSKPTLFECFSDTGSPVSIVNPDEGKTIETDKFMSVFTNQTPQEVNCELQGVGGGKLVAKYTYDIPFNLTEKIINHKFIFLVEHEKTLPKILLGMDCLVHKFEGMHLRPGKTPSEIVCSFGISGDTVFEGKGDKHHTHENHYDEGNPITNESHTDHHTAKANAEKTERVFRVFATNKFAEQNTLPEAFSSETEESFEYTPKPRVKIKFTVLNPHTGKKLDIAPWTSDMTLDTGSNNNFFKKETLANLGIPWTAVDQSRKGPHTDFGVITLRLKLGNLLTPNIAFHVVNDSYAPMVLGRRTIERFKGNLNWDTRKWETPSPDNKNILKIPWHQVVVDPTLIRLRALKTIIIPARSHSKVALAPLSKAESENTEGLDKLIVPLAHSEDNPLRVAWGPTQLSDWAQVANTSNKPIVIQKGQVLAHLKCSQGEWKTENLDLSDPHKGEDEAECLIRREKASKDANLQEYNILLQMLHKKDGYLHWLTRDSKSNLSDSNVGSEERRRSENIHDFESGHVDPREINSKGSGHDLTGHGIVKQCKRVRESDLSDRDEISKRDDGVRSVIKNIHDFESGHVDPRDSDLSNGAKHDLETDRGAPHVSDNFDLQGIDSNDGMSVSLLTCSKDQHEKRVEYGRSQSCFVSSMQNVQVSTELTNSSLPLCTQVLQRGDLTSSQAGLVESTPTEVAPRSKATGPSCLNTVRHNEVLHKRCEKRHEGREDSTPSLECNEGSDHNLAADQVARNRATLASMGVSITATEGCRSEHEVNTLIAWCVSPEIQKVISKDGKLDFSAPPKHNQKCSIQTTVMDAQIKIQAYPSKTNPTEKGEILRQVEEKLNQGIIEKSSAPWSSNCVCINKNGKIRIAVDYRKLNSVTVKDNYLLPTVQEIMDSIEGTQWFTTVDACQAYHQIPMATERDKDLTSFVVPGGGLYRYKYMPFGLCNAGAVWTRFIDEVLTGLRWNICLVYADDILISTRSPHVEDHVRDLNTVFQRLAKYNIKVKADKIKLGLKELPFLGQLIGVDGCRPDPDKTKAITELPVPRNVHELRRVLGMFTYYRKYIPKFAEIAAPLYAFCGKNAQSKRNSTKAIDLGDEGLKSFHTLKQHLTTEPIMLQFPNWNVPFEIHCDASNVGIAAKLCQVIDKNERVIMYASKTLSLAERKYFAYEKEALGLVWSLELFKHYLKNKPFKVITDCRSLIYLKDKALNARVGRWMMRLQEYSFTIKHKAGNLITDVDPLSRTPLPEINPYDMDPLEDLYDADPNEEIPTYTAAAEEALTCGTSIFRIDSKTVEGHDVTVDRRCHEDIKEDTKVRINVITTKNNKRKETQKTPFFKCEKDLDGFDLHVWKEEQNKSSNTEIARIMKFHNKLTPKQLANQTQGFKLNKNGLLVKIGEPYDKIVVPESLKSFVIGLHHNIALHAHQGAKRLYKMIASKFYWPAQRKDITHWVESCISCAKRKTPRPMSSGLTKPTLANYPFEVVGIDLVGKCLETSKGYKWILTIIDHFSRWPIAIPLPDHKADTIARALYEHVICQYGVPVKILSDQGRELIGEALNLIYTRWGIKRVQTGGYNPQANGACERFHRWMHTSITQVFDRKTADWDEYLPAVLFAYRVSENDATGYSPYMLMHGRDPVLPADVIFSPESTPINEDSYVENMSERLRKALDATRRRQYENYLNNYERLPPRYKPVFKKGDQVLVWSKVATEARLEIAGDKRALPTKWRNPWIGLATFIRELSSTMCEIELGGKTLSYNYNRISKFTPWDEFTTTTMSWNTSLFARDQDRLESEETTLASNNEEILKGDVILFRLKNNTHSRKENKTDTCAVGKVTDIVDGWINFQWMGNYNSNHKTPYVLGWIANRDNQEYYAKAKLHPSHKIFDNESTQTYIKANNVLLHGNRVLKSNGCLSKEARQAIEK